MSQNNIEKIIKEISKEWFYSSPLFFNVLCSHSIVQNPNLSIPIRSGAMRIEYSPALLESLSTKNIEALLQKEITRILLAHPYKRRPYNAKPGILYMASEAARIQAEYKTLDFLTAESANPTLEFLAQQIGPHATFEEMTFEKWYKYIYDLVKKAKGGSSLGTGFDENFQNYAQASELWEENEEALNSIQQQIQKADIENGFGEAGENLERALKTSSDFSFDYRRALSKFRQNVVSPDRKLTRMRPSRRYGFKAMGSRYERKANILIAVDVSGSITDESFDHFIHAVKNFFYLGIIEKIDLIFFDVNLKLTKPVSFRKKVDLSQIKGRGGTNFQVAVDFYFEQRNNYSGMIIFTDGEGAAPKIPAGLNNLLWILDSRINFEKSRQWITKVCKNQATYLPF